MGLGVSFARPSIAFTAIADLSLPSFGARSNRIGFTLAFARCAAICAPMTPAPSTAALRMSTLPFPAPLSPRAPPCGDEPGPNFGLSATSLISSLLHFRDDPRLAPLVHGHVRELRLG